MSLFDEDYFERGDEKNLSLYTAYRWMPELTIPLAAEIIAMLGIHKGERILDFGCSKGYLVKAFRLLHHEAWGIDISDYALSQAPDDVKPFVSNIVHRSFPATFSWVISKDTLEHVSYEDLPQCLLSLREKSHRAFVIVPLGDGQRYNYPDYEKDVTHVIREDIHWWCTCFEDAGFKVRQATSSMPFVKKARCSDSDGFFVLA